MGDDDLLFGGFTPPVVEEEVVLSSTIIDDDIVRLFGECECRLWRRLFWVMCSLVLFKLQSFISNTALCSLV
jgi:hypothetical protein